MAALIVHVMYRFGTRQMSKHNFLDAGDHTFIKNYKESLLSKTGLVQIPLLVLISLLIGLSIIN